MRTRWAGSYLTINGIYEGNGLTGVQSHVAFTDSGGEMLGPFGGASKTGVEQGPGGSRLPARKSGWKIMYELSDEL